MQDSTLPARLPIGRYLFVGGLVPAFSAWLDDRMLSAMFYSWSSWSITQTLAVFVVQVGVFGVLCGRWIDWPLIRWLIYGWCWFIVDLQLFVASTLVRPSYYDAEFLLPGAMFGAQIGLVTIWAVLGTTWWGLRLPVSLVLAALLSVPMARGGYHYIRDMHYLFAIQSFALLALCVALRRMRFRLLHEPTLAADAQLLATYARWKQQQSDEAMTENALPAAEAQQKAAAAQELRKRQFGLRHVMLWTTSLAIVLGIARALDLLSSATIKDMIGRGWIGMLTMGLLSAIVLIVALWAGLGFGRVWLRCLLMAVVATLIGLAAATIEYAHFSYRPGNFSTQMWSFDYWQSIVTNNWSFVVQNIMAGSLLYASLLIFRTLGYRLLRTSGAKTIAAIPGAVE